MSDGSGKFLGKLSESGYILDPKGNQIAPYPKIKKDVISLNGKHIGIVEKDGNAVDFDGNPIGKLNLHLQIMDKNGKIIGNA